MSALMEGLRRVVNPGAYGADIVLDAVERNERYLGEYKAAAKAATLRAEKAEKEVALLAHRLVQSATTADTVAELDALAAGAVLQDKDGDPWRKLDDGSWRSQMPGATVPISSAAMVEAWAPFRRSL